MSSQIYDSFGKAGYSLTDYNEKWMTPNGLGEMAVKDKRSFSGGARLAPAVSATRRVRLSANPTQGRRCGVYDAG